MQEIMSTITSPLVGTNNRPEGKEHFIWKDFELHAKCITIINKYKMVISNHALMVIIQEGNIHN